MACPCRPRSFPLRASPVKGPNLLSSELNQLHDTGLPPQGAGDKGLDCRLAPRLDDRLAYWLPSRHRLDMASGDALPADTPVTALHLLDHHPRNLSDVLDGHHCFGELAKGLSQNNRSNL